MERVFGLVGWVVVCVAAGCADSEGSTSTAGAPSTEASSANGDDSMPGNDSSPTSSDSGPASSTSASSTSGDSDDATSSDSGPESSGCNDAIAAQLPDDPSEPGPWPVGVRTVDIDGLTVEVWYPASPQSQQGATAVTYDIREQLPQSERAKISDEDNPLQTCDCYRDLDVDTSVGRFPLILFVHGTAAFRTQSLPQMTHWASRGFVVIAADHPGLFLADNLALACLQPGGTRDLAGNIDSMLSAARGETPGLEFIADSIDPQQLGAAGHSAGGSAIAALGDRAKVLVPMASGGAAGGAALESTLVLGATADSIVDYSQQVGGFESSPAPKRLVGIENTGHLAFSEICSLRNPAGLNLLETAEDNGVCGAQFAGFLFQCDTSFIPDPEAWSVINYATAGVFEEVLLCADRSAALAQTARQFPAVSEYREQLQ